MKTEYQALTTLQNTGYPSKSRIQQALMKTRFFYQVSVNEASSHVAVGQKKHEEPKNTGQKYTYSGYSFTVPPISKNGVNLIPRPYPITKCIYHSKILGSLHSIWDINKFNIARTPVEIGEVPDPHTFCSPAIRVLDMPIKLAGSNDYKIPAEVTPFLSTIQMIVDHEHSVLSEEQLLSYYAYITIDQSYVKAGEVQRKPGAHVDGFQGARVFPKTLINHSYVVCNGTPTVFYPHSFNFSHLDERIHNCFLEMDVQADENKAIHVKPYTVYLMDAYTVHRADISTGNYFRTFVRISYDVKEFDRLGNTINPLLHYSWEMVPRAAQAALVRYQSVSDYEKKLLISADFKILYDYIAELKNSNLERYYNFSYAGLQSKNSDVIRIILENLSLAEKPNIQELRLMFIAATQDNLENSQLSKIALINHLKRAKHHIKDDSFLDFVLEMITQKPHLLPKYLLTELINRQEHTPQGKEIIRSMRKFSNLISQIINPFNFWNMNLSSKIPMETINSSSPVLDRVSLSS